MAVNLPPPAELYPVAGVRLGTQAAGLRYANRPDLVLIEISPGTQAVAVFTRNRFCAAPVIVAREHLARQLPRALLINAGYANAGSGTQGLEDARACCRALSELLGCTPEEILPFSTGVIGERLPVERLCVALPRCIAALDENGWLDAAHGIMTTDTVAKGASRRVQIADETITLTGIVKGSGMIRPDMATMLAFLATDARVGHELLRKALQQAVARSFNRITVDGDTSTNDAVVLLATGRRGQAPIQEGSSAYASLVDALSGLCLELAQACVRDAEGATKFITVDVAGGADEATCLEVAYTIAHSPLVKTAFFASDPNWGRILAAIGRAPARAFDPGAVSIHIDDLCIFDRGAPHPAYTEEKGRIVMRKAELTLRIILGRGPGAARIWTCDLSDEYIRINAAYRS